ncbi:MAG: hypothetical protein HKN39_05160 [Flavobacteriales bacterium]|nr:hypothetical protein [Flavobacteriales bacterium]
MIDPLIIAGAAFLASIFGARFISENAFKLLDQEQKAGLIDILSPIRKKTLVAVIIIVALFFLLYKFSGLGMEQLFLMYFGLLLILMLSTTLITRNILKKQGFPKKYIQQYMFATAIRYFGIGVFLIVLLMNKNFAL